MLAKELESQRLVVDDLDARRFAQRAGLSVVGTLGLLLAAKLRGELPSLRAEIERLESAGFHMSERLIVAVLSRAGE